MKTLYLFKPTHLPKDGWFQGCVKCNIITGISKKINNRKLPIRLFINSKTFNRNIETYICKNCVRNKHNIMKYTILSLENSYLKKLTIVF